MVSARDSFVKGRDSLAIKLGLTFQTVFGAVPNDVSLELYQEKLNIWKANVSRLQRWTQFNALWDACEKTIAKPVLNLVCSLNLAAEDVLPCFEANYADCILKCVFKERPTLANFEGSFHENKIKRFADLDNEIIIKNRERLSSLLQERRPSVMGGASQASEAGILLSEFNRQRGHMPIRKLMSRAGGLIQKIKPCFMMSPLSIAQFLDPNTVGFDVVIFDEASQVRPEDALGALLRGKQVVVMGDSKQLPPTSFFDHLSDTGEDDYEDSERLATVTEVESILNQCKRSFPSRILRWHYRSKHESLIAVSNQEFYDNNLLIYPSSFNKCDSLGLSFVHLSASVYDRGKSSVNIDEAKVVAKAVLEHYQKYPKKSLGVGTFNIKQQQAILEQIELLIQSHPEIEDFLKSDRDEHFFVKNLETIQGDERDVIFLSVGFGFDQNRLLSLNFGPLNQQGGERRLNVLTVC